MSLRSLRENFFASGFLLIPGRRLEIDLQKKGKGDQRFPARNILESVKRQLIAGELQILARANRFGVQLQLFGDLDNRFRTSEQERRPTAQLIVAHIQEGLAGADQAVQAKQHGAVYDNVRAGVCDRSEAVIRTVSKQ